MDDLELIKQKISIVDLIGEYLPLKKAGVNYKTNCPFHGEKTASFMVSPERGIWHCFGCGKGGDHFKFLMEKEGLDFKDALEILAKKAGIVLKKKSVKTDFKDRLYELNLKAQEFFSFILSKHPVGQTAREYLVERGLTDETVSNFGIGYSPNSWENLTKFLLKRGFTIQEVINAGLAVPSKSGGYDRFRGRIVFPLIDQKERVIGFSGRVILSGEPKYINSPQTAIFDKSNYLFAINLAKSEMRNKNLAILVEGEMDVIMSHQAGIKNVVASKGTGLTAGQIELIKKYTDNIAICFDTDLAGDGGARRGIELADAAGLNIKVIQVKGGKDPADAIKADIKLWEQAIADATPIYDYYLASADRRFDSKTSIGIKSIASELIPIWAKITNDLEREKYTQKLAALLRMDETIIRQTLAKERTSQRASNISQAVRQNEATGKDDKVASSRSRRELLEEYLIALLLHIPKDLTFVPKFPETLFVAESLRQIFVFLVIYLDSISFKAVSFNINNFYQTIPPELKEEVDRLYLTDLDNKLTEKALWQKELDGVVLELKRALIKASLEKLAYEIKNAQEFGKLEAVETLNKRFRDLSVKLKNL